MKKILKNEKGIATTDGLVAILVAILFTGIIATLLYNIYIANVSVKRITTANTYIIDIFEQSEKMSYEDVTAANLITYFNEKYYNNDKKEAQAMSQDGTTDAKYKVIINVQKYNQTQGNQDKEDIVEEITLTVKYKLGNKNQEINMKHIKTFDIGN